RGRSPRRPFAPTSPWPPICSAGRHLSGWSVGWRTPCSSSPRRNSTRRDCSPKSERMKTALTFDVEEYFHAEAFARVLRPEEWPTLESRVTRSTERLLDILDRERVRATFFVLGWVAERHPALVREIASLGHEIACHGYGHRMIQHLSRPEFERDVTRAKRALEDAVGRPVLGYRAPTFSIMRATLWSLDVLVEAGFRYDSSIFPLG